MPTTRSQTKTKNKPLRYIYYDFETTGFNPFHSEIIEIGAIDDTERVFSMFLRPVSGKVPPRITELTGITTDMVEAEGVDPKQGFQDFLDWINLDSDTHDTVLVAHNNDAFDGIFLRQYISKFRLSGIQSQHSFIDTLRLAQFILPRLKSHSQPFLLRHFNIINTKEHRAIGDCVSLKRLARMLQSLFYRQYQIRDLKQLKTMLEI